MAPGIESVTLRIAATSEQVRTARLVAGAAARKASLDPDQVEDVRLAVSEACNRALLRQQAAGVDAMLTIVLAEYDDEFVVEVFDGAGLEANPGSTGQSPGQSPGQRTAEEGIDAGAGPDAWVGREGATVVDGDEMDAGSDGEPHLELDLESEALAEALLTSLVPGASVEGPITRVRWARESTPAIG